LVDIKDSADFGVKLQSNGLGVYQKRTHQLHQQATAATGARQTKLL